MKLKSIVSTLLSYWPGKSYFGIYRFLPLFFLGGMTVEYAMIHWRPNGINFYDTFKKKRAQELALERYNMWKEVQTLSN